MLMAVIKLGAIVTQISGKLGGNVFGKGSAGSFMRANAYNANKKTQKQLLQQSKIASLSTFWTGVIPSERDFWEAQTPNYPFTNKVGDVAFYTGFQLFLKLNSNLLVIKQPTIKIASVFVAVLAPVFSSIVLEPTVFTFTLLATQVTDDIAIYASRGLAVATTNVRSELRQIFTSKERTVIQNLDLIAEYTEVFGQPVVGKRVFIALKAVNFSTGNSTAITQETSVIVQAGAVGIGVQIIGTSNIIG